MRAVLAACIAIIGSGLVVAQSGTSAQQLFEAGENDQALRAIAERREAGAAGPADGYLAGLILVKMNQPDNARREFEQLAQSGESVWQLIGNSSVALVNGDSQRALDVANQAVAAAPGQFQTQYQLGLVKARLEDWSGSAEAFERASQANPTFAYAHYYAGLAYSRSNQVDQTAVHFERFLKLAPKAPERGGVESIMRTLRGR